MLKANKLERFSGQAFTTIFLLLAYPSDKGNILALSTNIKLGWRGLQRAYSVGRLLSLLLYIRNNLL